MLTIYTQHPITQRLALTAAIAAFVIVVFGVSFGSMWDLWQTSDHRHGLLVFPISAFLIWRIRHTLSDAPLDSDARGLILLVPLVLAWIVARLAGIQVAEQFFAVALIPATLVTLAGVGYTYKLLFPLLFLFLSIPLGETLVPHLMRITADISTGLLKLSGFPLLRNGQYISLPGGEFVVADVCAGLRYLISGVTISLLYGYLTYTKAWKRLVLVVTTAVLLVVTNGIRAYIVMAVASSTNMQYLGGRDHIYFGWLLFGVVMMLIMWFGTRYADEEDLGGPDLSDTMAIRASHSGLPLIGALGLVMLAVTVAPLQADFGEFGAMVAAAAALLTFIFFLVRHNNSLDHTGPGRSRAAIIRFGWRRGVTVLVTLAVLIMTPRFAATVEGRAVESVADPELNTLVPCTAAGAWQEPWQPRFNLPDLESSASYSCSGTQVSVYVAAYASALQGRELVSSSHQIVPPQWDRISKSSSYVIAGRDGLTWRVREIQVDDSVSRALVWHWYEVDGRVATSQLTTKSLQVLALLRGRPAGGRVVVIVSHVDSDFPQARERLRPVAGAIIGMDTQNPLTDPP